MKKIIFSDVDGTIKPDGQEISDFTKDVIKKVKAKGYEFILATGRNRRNASKIAEQVGGCRYLVTCNGGEVLDVQSGKSIFAISLPKESLQELYDIAKKYDLKFILNINADFRFASRITYFDGGEKELTSLDEVLEKYSVISGVLSQIPDKVLTEVRAKVLSIKGITIPHEGHSMGINFIDFGSEFANKGIGIKKLLNHLNMQSQDTISFGNDKNDMPMFIATNEAVVVKGASEGLKSVADVIVGECEDDGVAKYLLKLIQ